MGGSSEERLERKERTEEVGGGDEWRGKIVKDRRGKGKGDKRGLRIGERRGREK